MSRNDYQRYGGNPHLSVSGDSDYVASTPYGITPTQSLQVPATTNNRLSGYSGSFYSTPVTQANTNNSSAAVYSLPEFLNGVDSTRQLISQLSSNITQIGTLHQRLLSDVDSTSTSTLESIVTQTQILNTQIRDRIKSLELDAARTPLAGPDNKTKQGQVKALKGGFERELESYRQEERTYQQRYRDQIARQYRIVNPEASEAEVNEARNADWGDEGIFQTALRSNRSGAASSVLGAVRARHNEVQRIEATLVELAQMFQDLGQAVVAQEVPVERIEQDAEDTVGHVDQGNKQLDVGIRHARNTRKLWWWLLLVVFLIIGIIALVLGLVFGLRK